MCFFIFYQKKTQPQPFLWRIKKWTMPALPFIDIHTHTYRPSDATVWSILNVTQTDLENLPFTEGGISIGLHPYFLTRKNAGIDLEKITQLIDNQEVIAIGECGLDRLHGADLAFQTLYFERQIRLAEAVGKPVVIHCVRAFSEVMAVKKRLQPTVPLVIHGFVKNADVLRGLLDHDFYISIGAAILRGDKILEKTVCEIPNNRLFLETDDSAIAIELIYEAMTKVRNVSLMDLKSMVYENFKSVFGEKKLY
jgi:TatD DNase family protein